MPEKNRAPFNRSLTVIQEEKEELARSFFNLDKKTDVESLCNKVVNNDVFTAVDYLPDSFVDLMIIDPPYNLSKNYSSTTFKAMNETEYIGYIDSWLSRLIRLLKPHASVYICCDWKSSSAVYQTASKYLKVKNRITWEREKGRGHKTNWKNCSEDIWYFTKGANYTFNLNDVKIKRKVLAPYTNEKGIPKDWNVEDGDKFRVTHPSNFWNDITVPFWSMPENTQHPTQKPEKLLAKLILASSNEGDLVFDPFGGSGSTVVTAKKLNRKFLMIEKEFEYCCMAQKRIKLADCDSSIQGYDGKTFFERNSKKA